MTTIAILPMKAHSERVPGKNFRHVEGVPLYQRIIATAMASKLDAVYCYTDSDEIMEFAIDKGCLPLFRGPGTEAHNGNWIMSVPRQRIIDSGVRADVWMKLQCTSPFLRSETIDEAIWILDRYRWFDSLLTYSVVKDQFLWRDNTALYQEVGHGRTQDWPELFVSETHGIKAIRDNALAQLGKTVGSRPFFLEVTGKEAMDIDWEADIERAQESGYTEGAEDLPY